ncbi:MAG: hypothetical protein HN731_01725 [Rhodospirillaceae bacterium]|nr:hypothetical protein [Rhodospirillaceae bacterium]MBT7953882.1 hypothetical protein [Rhodospirillaceae bacterium]
MSALDLSHSPSIEAVIIGLHSRDRFDLVESETLEDRIPVFDTSSYGPSFGESEDVNAVEFIADSEESVVEYENVITLAAHNSRIEAQEFADPKLNNNSDNPIKKGIAIVASPSEAVGTDDALVRLDQNGDGRINQVEVKKGIRANDESTTFAALSQYQKSLELYQKISEADEYAQSNLFSDEEVKVEKLFDDENLDQDLYQEQPRQQPQDEQHAEVVA